MNQDTASSTEDNDSLVGGRKRATPKKTAKSTLDMIKAISATLARQGDCLIRLEQKLDRLTVMQDNAAAQPQVQAPDVAPDVAPEVAANVAPDVAPDIAPDVEGE